MPSFANPNRVGAGDHGESRQGLHAAAMAFVDEAKPLVVVGIRCRPNAKRIERQIALIVARGAVRVLRPECLIDVDEFVAALTEARFDVLNDGAQRLHHAADVLNLTEVVDLLPTRLDVVRRHVTSEPEQFAFGSLPSEARIESSADLVDAASRVTVLAAKVSDERRYVLGLERIEHRGRKQPLGEARRCKRAQSY